MWGPEKSQAWCSIMVAVIMAEHQEEDDKQDGDKAKKPVAGDPLFVAHGAQALKAAGRQVTDQAGIGGIWTAQIIAPAIPQGRQIVFSHAEIIEQFRRGRRFRRLNGLLIDLLTGLGGGRGSAGRAAAAPDGSVVDRILRPEFCCSLVSNFLIWDSSAAICSFSARALSEMGSFFFFSQAMRN